MKIVCPNCATTYEVSSAAIGENGRSVRCVRCRGVWFVGPEHDAAPDLAAASVSAAAPVAPAVSAAAVPAGMAPPAATMATAAAAAAVPDAGLDDLAAWGLADAPAAGPQAEPGAAVVELAGPAFSMDPMLREMEAAVPMTDGPPLVPVDDWQGAMGELPPPVDDESSGPHRPRRGVLRRKPGFRAPSMPTVILVLMAIIAGILGWRADVVRVMPQTASLFAAIGLPVNLRGLAFEDVKATKDIQDGVPVLVLEGRIVNISRLMLEVPRIRFAMRNAAGNEVYNWTTLPIRPVLPPNAEQAFRTRLASPPAEGRDITIRFFTRHDAVGGFR